MDLGHRRSANPQFKSHCKAVQRHFSKLSPSERSQFKQQNLQTFLNGINKSPFDTYLVRELMKRMEMNEFSQLDVDRVIEAYVDLELDMGERVELLRQKNDQISQTATEFKRQELHAKNDPRNPDVNARTVFVEIKRIKHIVSSTGTANPVVELSFEGQKRSTKVIQKDLNPEFNEHFEFKVVKGTEPIKIEVFDYVTKELKGYSIVPISNQQSDQFNTHTTNLMSSVGSVVDTLIEFTVGMADNKVRLYGLLSELYQQQAEKCRADIDLCNDHLMKLQSPFGLTLENSFINYSGDNFRQIDDIVTGRLDNFIKSSLGKEIELGKATAIVMCLLAFFSSFVMYARPDFFSVIARQTCLGAMSLMLYMMGSPSPVHYKNLAFGVAVSEIYDVVWILFVGIVMAT